MLITVQARDALEEFHSNDVRELARLYERINALKTTNPSSPDLGALQKSYDDLLASSKTRGEQLFKDFAVQGAIMFAAPAVFIKLTAGGTRATIHALEKEGVLVRDPKVEHPHYDPETERILIGKETPSDDILASLQDAWMRDTNSKRARIGMMLDSEKVEVKRVKGDGPAKVTKDGDKYLVEVPEGRKFDDVLDDVWKHRKGELGPGAVRPEIPNLAPTFDVSDVLTKKNVIVGNPIAEQAHAHDLMRKMAAGDKSAFDALGLERPEKFDPRSVEWGLGRLPSDGSFVIIRGEAGAVDWSKVPGVEPIAHSHPFGDYKKLKNTDGGIPVKELVSGKAGDANRVNVLPSASDFRFAAEHDLIRHTVHTPYVHVGGKKIANPSGKKGDTIDIVIARPERVGDFAGNPEIGVYKADIAIRAGDEVLWSGTMYAARHPSVGDIVDLELPPGTLKRDAAGSGSPTGTGSGGPDPHVKPDADPTVKPDDTSRRRSRGQARRGSGRRSGVTRRRRRARLERAHQRQPAIQGQVHQGSLRGTLRRRLALQPRQAQVVRRVRQEAKEAQDVRRARRRRRHLQEADEPRLLVELQALREDAPRRRPHRRRSRDHQDPRRAPPEEPRRGLPPARVQGALPRARHGSDG